MHIHESRCLKGPVTSTKDWWPRSIEHSFDDEVPSLDEPGIRADLVCRVRREIAEGIYETPEKMEQALKRLLEELE